MAWRIHDNVIRGEIDNRTRGIIRGRIWVHGLGEPVVLELTGNAHPDLAGCLLTFENTGETYPVVADSFLALLQQGTAGDLTASRKVRVFEVPVEEALAMMRRGDKPPEHWANSLYLEWFSERNGRVVIEGAEWHLKLSPPEWRPTADDEIQRRLNAEKGWRGFLQQLDAAVNAKRHRGPEEIEDWDEFDWERALRESDARADKYRELLEKYGDGPDAERLIAREMGWDDADDDNPDEGHEVFPSESFSADPAIEDLDDHALEPDPATEGVDWIRSPDGHVRHPLEFRCFESAVWLWHECRRLGDDVGNDRDVARLVGEFQTTGAKLAGALNGLAYGRHRRKGAFVVACLKRALRHLHSAQAGFDRVSRRGVLPKPVLDRTRAELFAIREEILRLMQEFRESE
jgi:hypothetical protein